MSVPDPASVPPGFGRQVALLALGFATVYFCVATLVWGLAGSDPVATAGPKLIGMAEDALLAAAITLALWRLRRRSLGAKALAAILMALALAPVSALIDRGMEIWCTAPDVAPFNAEGFVRVVIFTTSELFGWSCLYLALQYNARARETERRLAVLREEALTAQMRALHYQVNPHFLFNTLNSIAGLIEEGASQPARDMTLRLAGFLRRTLALDPAADVRLAEEVALQTDYLAIEEARFSDRLEVRLSLPDGLRDALVPALILQPLVENAIKHGVARTPGRALVEIGANRAGADLRLWVESPAPASDSPGAGLGIGLANVSARLAARWPGHAGCAAGRVGEGRVRAELRLPLGA